MKEDFLHYIWKLKYFKTHDLTSASNEPIQIMKSGEHNTNAGPDFFNARIKIGNTLWAGNVEIHVKASDWVRHLHSQNKAYDNIILHVVYENDFEIKRKNGTVIPVLELKKYMEAEIWDKYVALQKSTQWIPCQKRIKEVDEFTINHWLDRLLIERLENKTKVIADVLKLNKNNWEETFFQFLAKNFGFKVNAVPFELLAKSLPLAYLGKHKNSLMQLEALLLGQAGFLNDIFIDDYSNELKKEYTFLKQKFNLHPIEKSLWKFMRLRPINFPTIRIAQFAGLIYKSTNLFSQIVACKTVHEVELLFKIAPSVYWQSHFIFDKSSQKQLKSIGKASIDNLIINTIVPFLFIYGAQKKNDMYKEMAIALLENIRPENNSIISKWNELGIKSDTAYTTQGLIQLKNEYCIQKKCLNCTIGNKLIHL